MNNEIIGKNLRELRDALGFSQEQAAHYLEVSREMVSYYETGARLIPPPVLMKAADLYGVAITDLLELSPKQSKLNAALSFRATNIAESDLTAIATFKRIARNYVKAKEKLKSND